MKVLIVGGGGREHAIGYTLNKSEKVDKIFAIPGNPGMESFATCIKKDAENVEEIVEFVEQENIDFTIVGPEVPLCKGLADALEKKGRLVFGPKQKSAMLEGSKAFSKQFMIRHNIPTAKYVEVECYEKAINELEQFDYPVVIKADGLAAGKGVVICQNKAEAIAVLKEMMVDKSLKEAGSKVILEEFLTGFECSLLCFCDGKTIVPMVSAKDHKQIFDGNTGPNTGGMGTVSPNPFIPKEMDEILKNDILTPFIKGLEKENMDYRGVIFIGLMIENNKAKVLEFNVRFGDPETQSILLRLDSDLFEIMYAVATKTLDKIDIKWKDDVVACLVLVSNGYPGTYQKGKVISNLDKVDNDIIIFHAGTTKKENDILTNGGRVLNLCASGSSLEEVRQKVYKAAEVIEFEGKYYRKDIGLI